MFAAAPSQLSGEYILLNGKTGLDNGKHPVWCDGNAPVELSLFKPQPNTLNATVAFDSDNPADPVLTVLPTSSRRQFMCEDP
jgi:hypothetical protein